MATVPKCKTKTGSRYDPMFQTAAERVSASWGSNAMRLGATLYRALLAEAVYALVMAQGSLMSDEIRGEIMKDGWVFISEHLDATHFE